MDVGLNPRRKFKLLMTAVCSREKTNSASHPSPPNLLITFSKVFLKDPLYCVATLDFDLF
jgi:hypothetical protein